jgi:excisionase family DNA binding protein
MDDEYLTISQAAELLGYYRTSVYHLIAAKKLRSRVFGPRALMVHRGDVEALRERGRPAAGRKRPTTPEGASDGD